MYITVLQALVSHSNKLPDDVIGPVLPPILPSPSFELPRIQRQQHSNSLDDPSLPERPVSAFYLKFLFCFFFLLLFFFFFILLLVQNLQIVKYFDIAS